MLYAELNLKCYNNIVRKAVSTDYLVLCCCLTANPDKIFDRTTTDQSSKNHVMRKTDMRAHWEGTLQKIIRYTLVLKQNTHL